MNIIFVTVLVLTALVPTIPCSFYGMNQKIGHTIRLVYKNLSPEVMKAAQREDIQFKSLGSSFTFPQIQSELINIG